MKIVPGARHMIPGMVFLLSVMIGQADALIVLSQTKAVTIDNDWHITGRYTRIFKITRPTDTRELKQLIGQLEAQTNSSAITVARVQLPDGSVIPWAPVGGKDLPSETQVRLTATITKNFPGFSGLFADTLHIDQDDPVRQVTYRIQFPRETPFVHQVILNDKSLKNTDCADGFAWSGKDVCRLDILVSTATSWDQITRRYHDLFQNRRGKGLLPSELPEKLREIEGFGSADEKIRAVMDFLHNNVAYRRASEPSHTLLPDSPQTVLHRKWGDCKDLALLGTALLREINVETFVVLTGTPRLDLPREAVPDPFIFDHALVGFLQNGKTTYYDCLAPDRTVAVNQQNIYLPLKVFDNDQ